MKKIIRVMALALVLLMLAGCAVGTKEFTCRDLTITVPGNLKDVSSRSEFAAYTFTLDSSDLAVFGLQESYAEYPVLEGYSLQEYTDLVIQANNLTCSAVKRAGGDYYYFTYDYQTEAGAYRYLTGTFQSDAGFWMVQITGPILEYNESEWFEYMDSIVVD